MEWIVTMQFIALVIYFRSLLFFLSLGALWLVPSVSFARDFEQYSDIRFSYYRLTAKDGIGSGGIERVIQDESGFMWFASEQKLFRWNGQSAREYHPNSFDSGNLAGSLINCLFIDSKGLLWIGTGNGAQYYCEDIDRFSEEIFPNIDGRTSFFVTAIEEDNLGCLWFGTEQVGLVGYDRKLKKSQVIDISSEKLNTTSVVIRELLKTENFIDDDGDSLIWVGTNLGLFCLDSGSKEIIDLNKFVDGAAVLDSVTIRALDLDDAGNLWIGSEKGLYRLNQEDRSVYSVNDENKGEFLGTVIETLRVDEQGFLWVGSADESLTIYYPALQTTIPFTSGNSGHDIDEKIRPYWIYKSPSGRLWIASSVGSEIYSISRKDPSLYPMISNHFLCGTDEKVADVWRVIQDSDNNLWTASNNSGLTGLHPTRNETAQYCRSEFEDMSIVCYGLLEDRDGIIWVGCTNGAFRFKRDGLKLTPAEDAVGYQIELLKDRFVWTFFQDSKGRIYISTRRSGFYIWDLEKEVVKHYYHDPEDPNSLGSNYTYTFYEQEDGRIWLSSIGFGISLFDPEKETFTHFPADTGTHAAKEGLLNNNAVMTFHDSGDGLLWMGTNGGGLNRLDKESGHIDFFNETNGLPSGTIYSIVPESDGRMVLACEGAIVLFDPETLEVHSTPVDHYSNFDGFHGDNAVRIDDNTIAFSGEGGVLLYNHQRLREASVESKTNLIISDLSLMGKSIFPREEVRGRVLLEEQIHTLDTVIIPHNERQIRFSFAWMNFEQLQPHHYQTKLEPLEDDWTQLGRGEHSITYRSLKPGKYTLHVRARSSGQDWTDQERVLHINIPAPFWLKIEYQIAMAAALITIAFFINFLIIRNTRIRNQKLEEINHKLESEIETRIETEKSLIKARNIAEKANRTKDEFMAMVSHELKTPLNPILGFSELILMDEDLDEEHRDSMSNIVHSGNRLLTIIDQILDFSNIQSQQIKIETNSFEIIPFLEDIETCVERLIGDKQLELKTDFSAFEPFGKEEFVADTYKIKQILLNLLSNAYKFTREGSIYFTTNIIEEQDNLIHVRFIVEDTGIGISDEYRDRVFDSFVQEDSSLTREYGGLGLGLKICKEMAEILGGKLWFESEKNKGSIFYFETPLAKD